MTSPGVNGCWCGCDKPVRESEFWATERCAQTWVRRVNQVPLVPLEKKAWPAAAAAFTTQYMRAVEGAKYPQVASENPQVECGQPGWLGRLFERMFGKGAT